MSQSHIVKAFDKDLAELDAKIARMGALAEEELEGALRALRKRDPDMAEQVILRDREIDRLEQQVEDGAVSIIIRRQPMAADLRQVIGALKTANELERIGDLSKNISRRVITLAASKPPKPLKKGLKRMGKLVIAQLHDVLDAYARRDAELALKVREADEEVDESYSALFRELLTYMMEDPRTIGMCTHLLFGARNLERIGDHVTNIAENIHYLVTGERLDISRPKSDTTTGIIPEPARQEEEKGGHDAAKASGAGDATGAEAETSAASAGEEEAPKGGSGG